MKSHVMGTLCSVVTFVKEDGRDVRCRNEPLLGLVASSPVLVIFKRVSGLRFVDDCGRACPICLHHFAVGARYLLASATSVYVKWMYERWIRSCFSAMGLTDMNQKYMRAIGTGRVL
jgi:hypothetical protein